MLSYVLILLLVLSSTPLFFFFNDTATTEIYTLSLHDALPIFDLDRDVRFSSYATPTVLGEIKRHFRDKTWAVRVPRGTDRKSTRLNSSHANISYAVFCLKKKKNMHKK